MTEKAKHGNFAYQLTHAFKYPFVCVATAFWCKYKQDNSYNLVTIAGIKQVNDNKFVFIRRMDDGKELVEYEHIKYERQKQKIVADHFVNEKSKQTLSERCVYVYNAIQNDVEYHLLVFKENWNRYIRKMAFNWGVGVLDDLLKKVTPVVKAPLTVVPKPAASTSV